jgi:hypothetical protein
MINQEALLESLVEPMQRYLHAMSRDFGDWQPLEDAAELLLQGKPVPDGLVLPNWRPLVDMMRLIMERTNAGTLDWTEPDVRRVFQAVAEGALYRLFSDVLVDMVLSIMKNVRVGSLLEVGTGPGKVTASLCTAMRDHHLNDVPIFISDQTPTVEQVGASLRKAFPSLSIADVVWNIRQPVPDQLAGKLHGPVLLFERFCLPYAGVTAIDNLAPIADILLLVDDLSHTGKKWNFDLVYERIGTQFLTFQAAMRHLERHFSFIHTCDREIMEAVNSPVTTFTLALKSA